MSLNEMDCNELVELVTAYLDGAVVIEADVFQRPVLTARVVDREVLAARISGRDGRDVRAFRNRLLDAFKDFRD